MVQQMAVMELCYPSMGNQGRHLHQPTQMKTPSLLARLGQLATSCCCSRCLQMDHQLRKHCCLKQLALRSHQGLRTKLMGSSLVHLPSQRRDLMELPSMQMDQQMLQPFSQAEKVQASLLELA